MTNECWLIPSASVTVKGHFGGRRSWEGGSVKAEDLPGVTQPVMDPAASRTLNSAFLADP